VTVAGAEHVFVYGTLMPGRLRWPLLAPFARSHRPAVAAGDLYDTGAGWPVAVFGGGGAVPGVLVELDADRLAVILPFLDAVEDTATDTLRRIMITTVDGTRAWAYHCPGSIAAFTAIDRWHGQEER
jgi:gamma-glutamylcyclotransferase (GGCT)/AIG2-like uncharacterized protein YtfP